MRKVLMAALAALALSVLVAAPVGAGVDDLPDGAVLPDASGQCPPGFTLAYSGVCEEDLERDFGDAGDAGDAGAAGAGVTVAGTLPRTGSDSSLPLAKIGVVLVSLGALAVLATRKRADVVAPRS